MALYLKVIPKKHISLVWEMSGQSFDKEIKFIFYAFKVLNLIIDGSKEQRKDPWKFLKEKLR